MTPDASHRPPQPPGPSSGWGGVKDRWKVSPGQDDPGEHVARSVGSITLGTWHAGLDPLYSLRAFRWVDAICGVAGNVGKGNFTVYTL